MESVEKRLENFMDLNRSKIEFIGAQNGKIKEVNAILTNSKPNKNNFFVIDGIWAHQKALDNNLEVDSFIFCQDIITSHEGMNLVEELSVCLKKVGSCHTLVICPLTAYGGAPPEGEPFVPCL